MIGNIYNKTTLKRVVLFAFIQFAFSALFIPAQAQYTILEGSSNMKVLAGTKVNITGDILLQDTATIDNSGDITMTGDWYNNNAYSTGFVNGSPGTLHLAGDTEQITGAFATDFYNLRLEGTGSLKILAVSANILDSLYLNGFQLQNTGYGDMLTILNTDTGAISRTTGYISTDTTGSVAWQMDGAANYIFPVGSDHLYKYRPVGIQNTVDDSLMMSVGMADNSPTLNGYPTTLTDSTLCTVNNGFYDLISAVTGNSPVNLTFYYDTSDGSFNRVAYWPANEWSATGEQTFGTAPPFKTMSTANWSNFYYPYLFALGNRGPQVSPIVTSSGPIIFCQGSNDSLSVFSPGSYSAFQWSTGSIAPTIGVDSTGTYYVTVTAAENCMGTASQSVTLSIVNPSLHASGPTSFCDTSNVTLNVVGNFDSYQWNTGQTTSSITVNSSNTYTVTATGAGNCTGEASQVVQVDTCIINSIRVLSGEAIKVFPNPTNGLVNINIESLQAERAEITLFDLLGRSVEYQVSQGQSNITMYMGNLASGPYILNVAAGDNTYREKIILTH